MTDFEDDEQMCNRQRAFATLFLNTFTGFTPFFSQCGGLPSEISRIHLSDLR